MKKLLVLPLLAFIISCSSSSSSFDTDMKKAAELACKAQKLALKALSGDEKITKELENLQKEAEEWAKKMEEKYKDMKEDKAMSDKAEKIMADALANCK